MASVNLEFGDGGGHGCTSPARSPSITIGGVELCPPVVPVASPAAAAAASSSSDIQEQIAEEIIRDWCPPETEAGVGCEREGSGSGGGGGGNVVKKAVWCKPLNVVEVAGPVMGASSWPALGESSKRAAKSSSSSESLQALCDCDGSLVPALQVTGNSSPSSHKPASVDPALTANHVKVLGQRLMRRGGGISGVYLSANRGVSQGSLENQEPKDESQANSSGKPATASNYYPKEHTNKESTSGGFRSQTSSSNDNHYQRNSYRRGNGGPHPRGDGSYQHSYGGNLGQGQGQGQGRGNQAWNQQRNFNRDPNMHSQRGGFRRGGYIRPAVHNITPFVQPPMHPPQRPFVNNVLYPDVASGMIYFQGPHVPGPLYFHTPGPGGPDPLHDKIVKQINYYFSYDNLVKDTYLRRCMDEQGWVPVSLIAGFNKVSSLTGNVQLILDVMQKSTVVEVQGDKMRRRNDWTRWPIPPAVEDSLGSQLQGIGLDERISSRSSCGELCSQLQQGGGDQAPMA